MGNKLQLQLSLDPVSYDPEDLRRTTSEKATQLWEKFKLQWNSHPVTFHYKYGKCIQMASSNRLATRKDHQVEYSIVSTKDPVPIGQMLKVAVEQTASDQNWLGGLVS